MAVPQVAVYHRQGKSASHPCERRPRWIRNRHLDSELLKGDILIYLSDHRLTSAKTPHVEQCVGRDGHPVVGIGVAEALRPQDALVINDRARQTGEVPPLHLLLDFLAALGDIARTFIV